MDTLGIFIQRIAAADLYIEDTVVYTLLSHEYFLRDTPSRVDIVGNLILRTVAKDRFTMEDIVELLDAEVKKAVVAAQEDLANYTQPTIDTNRCT